MNGLIGNNMAPPPAEGAPDEAQVDAGAGDEGADENDPAFRQALQFAMSALYENGAAKQIADTLRKSQDVPEALANTAYEIVTIADERTNGAIPDELLVLFASNVLEEIVDIATAAQVKVQPSDIAAAMKQMILRYVGENGGDTSQLQAAMDKVDPSAFNGEAAPAGNEVAAPAEEPQA